MKFLALILMLAFSINTLAQKSYVDPSKRQKKGLLEEPLEEPAEEVTEAKPQTKGSKKLIRYCKCEKLRILYTKQFSLYKSLYKEEKIKYDWDTFSKFQKLDRKAQKITKRLKYKWELEDEDCDHDSMIFSRLKKIKKAIKAQKRQCDLDTYI